MSSTTNVNGQPKTSYASDTSSATPSAPATTAKYAATAATGDSVGSTSVSNPFSNSGVKGNFAADEQSYESRRNEIDNQKVAQPKSDGAPKGPSKCQKAMMVLFPIYGLITLAKKVFTPSSSDSSSSSDKSSTSSTSSTSGS